MSTGIKLKEDENIIVKMIYGSHLYGTATDQSDTDFKGIFIPNKRDILLGKIPKSYNVQTKINNELKNTANDVDTELYSLHCFIKLALEGQTVAIDMLHVNKECLLETSEIWENIVLNREKFYTKNLKAFIGYARRQAAKYGIKGSRLNAAKEIIDILSRCLIHEKLSKFWHILPEKEHLYHLGINENGIRQYQVCGKIIQETQTVGYTLNIIERFYREYGKRAEQAAENKGIDWKAVSHAIRAAYQVKELLLNKDIIFPLQQSDTLLKVKNGKMDYTTEVVPLLEGLMNEVETLSENSNLPEKPDYKFWENFVVETVCNYVL